jgi:hypothetical protein
MKQHRREYLISRIRVGVYLVEYKGITLTIYPPTLEQVLQSNVVYNEVFDEAYEDGLMDEEEMEEWMREQNIWTKEDDESVEVIKKDIEKLRIQIYENRHNDELKERIRLYLRAGEKGLQEQLQKQYQFAANTCEGLAKSEQHRWFIKNCTQHNGDKIKLKDVVLDEIIALQQEELLSEGDIRELARNEPWRSTWATKDQSNTNLFANNDRELNVDQKNIIIWSTMYDNIQEAADVPADDIIADDDVLDGWFVIQRKKRESEKATNDFDSSTTNERIKGAGEIYVMAGSEKEMERVEGMNNLQSKMIKKERIAKLRGNNELGQHEFRDEQLKLQNISNQQFKDKFKR